MKSSAATKQAIKKLNQAKNKLFQQRAQAQRDNLWCGQRGYPQGWLDTRSFSYRLY